MGYTIQQLATHARVSVRTVRYYIEKGEVPRPFGSRSSPIYTDAHLRALMRTRNELASNVRLGHIQESKPTPHVVRVGHGSR